MARKKPLKLAASNQNPAHEDESDSTGEPEETQGFQIVAVGASAGGVEAMSSLLRALPGDTGMAFVFVQHLDPTHASMLTGILAQATSMKVSEAQDAVAVQRDHVYVLPAGKSVTMERGLLRLTPRTEPRGQHRPIDLFMRSLAADQGHMAIGVVLSGSNNDGTLGLSAIKAEGGITFAQDQSAQHDSMPRSAIAAGSVDFVLPPAQIAAEIARIARHPFVWPPASIQAAQAQSESDLHVILDLLLQHNGVDFGQYKRKTLVRRIMRRVVLHKLDSLKDYARFLRGNGTEIEALYQDILINVTSFFRNPESFGVLKKQVFAALTRNRSRHDPVRVWVLGCSTGEEAYSIAMAFAEHEKGSIPPVPLQVFATDLNGIGIEKARGGVYSKSIVQDVSPERLRRFFAEVDGGYRINRSIRDSCVFARHNVLTEPPFSRMDLISCRNLLIYLEPQLQQRILPILHYGLKPSGFLWVGNSETIGSYRDLFEQVDAKHRIYSKKMAPARIPIAIGTAAAIAESSRHVAPPARQTEVAESFREADRVLLARYAPAGVLVNADLEILQVRGDTGPYLVPSPGRASLNLLRMLREGLLIGVRGAIHKARREETTVRETDLRVKSNGGWQDVSVQVIPIKINSTREGCLLVLFEQTKSGQGERAGEVEPLEIVASPAAARDDLEPLERENVRLKQDLAATREYLQSVIEQQEAANEELQSANEEVQSTNEELQSINEELETSKEEIQSSNEELATVNEELHNRNVEISQSNNDMLNLLGSVQMPILILGRDLRIRRFTPSAEKMLNVIASDVGRPIGDIKLNLDATDLESLLHEVLDTVSVRERDVRDRYGHWYSLRLRPYRTLENQIDGVVLMLVDIDSLKRNEAALLNQTRLLDQTHEPILMWRLDGTITYWNRGAEKVYGVACEQALGRTRQDILSGEGSATVIQESLKSTGQWAGELTLRRLDRQSIVVESRMALVRDADGMPLVLETDHPITERKLMMEALRARADELVQADRRKNEFLAMLAHELRNPLGLLGNAVELLKARETQGPLLDRVREMVERQVHNMARMVDDLLDAFRMARSRIPLHKERMDLSTVIAHAVELNYSSMEARRQELSVSLPREVVTIDGDRVRLEQVFGNLLNNASKFTPDGGHIRLEAARERAEDAPSTAEGKGGDEVVVRVIDDGMGIEPTLLPRLFQPFTQADGTLARTQGGLGIGLALVRHLIELHGGRVEAHSDGPGQGSVFSVRLPALPAGTGTQTVPQEDQEPEAKGERILVVDDNVDGAHSLAMVLRRSGHEVRVVHDGRSALDVACSYEPSVVLLDIGLPGMDGFETAIRMRALPFMADALLVAVTGYGGDEIGRRAKEAGFDHHLTKPLDFQLLHELLAKQRERRR